MIRTAENVVELTSRAAVAFEDDQAVRVSGENRLEQGRFKSVDGSTGGFAEWSRDVTGLDLEVHLRHLTRFGGLVVSLCRRGRRKLLRCLRRQSGVEHRFPGRLLRRIKRQVCGDGLRDVLGRQRQGPRHLDGRHAHHGRSVLPGHDGGRRGSFYPDWGGYKDVNFTGAVSLTNYLKSTYGIAFDGERVMDVEEESRWVGTLQLQAGWHRLFRPASSSWIKADVTLGGRVRAGDL